MGKIRCCRAHVAVTALATVYLLSGGAAFGSSDGPSRAEYVEEVEGICMRGVKQHGGILKGVGAMVRQNRLKAAGRRFGRAATALLTVIRQIARVRRPAADRDRIKTWLGHGKAGVRLLRRISQELKAGRRAAAEARADKLLAEIRQANATVVGFNLNYCRLRPARFV